MNLGTRLRGSASARQDGAAGGGGVGLRGALQERTRERVPLDWAQTQTNLDRALKALADRTKIAVADKRWMIQTTSETSS